MSFFNNQTSNIDWCDRTANPGTGCLHACPYCYAKGLAAMRHEQMGLPSEKPFRPLFHPHRFQKNDLPTKPCRIFLGSMADYGGDWEWEINYPNNEMGILPSGREVTNKYKLTPSLLWHELLTVIRASKHTYMVLTKNPRNMRMVLSRFAKLPENLWIGATVNNQKDLMTHAWELRQLKVINEVQKVFISYEPALDEIDLDHDWLRRALDWVIVGAQTGVVPIQPEISWLEIVKYQCQEFGIPAFFKGNIKAKGFPQEFPDESKKVEEDKKFQENLKLI